MPRPSMAPRGQKPSAARKKQEINLTPQKHIDDASTLLQKEAEQTKSSAKKQKVRSMDAAVQKALHDNFIKRGWDLASLDLVKREGKTVREFVTEAKQRQHDGDGVIGKFFYHDLRILFQDNGSAKHQMKVVDPSQPEDERISDACVALTTGRMETIAMDSIFEDDYNPPNQKNAKCMFASFLEVSYSTDAGSAFLIRALSYIHRNQLHSTYELLWDALKEVMDKALEKDYLSMKSAGLSQALWLKKHSAYLGIVADYQAIKQCVDTTTNWNDVRDELQRACQSHCGSRIFASKLSIVSNLVMSDKLQVIIAKLAGEDITTAAIKTTMEFVHQMAAGMGKDLTGKLSSEETIWYEYCGMKCSTRVNSLQQESMIRIHALAKTRAVRKGVLKPLWCEDELVLKPHDDQEKGVSEEVVADSVVARSAAAELLPSGSGTEIKNFLTSKHKLLVGMDRWWQIERDFWLSVVGEPGEAKLKDMVLSVLPSPENDAKPDEVLSKLLEITNGKLYEFVSVGVRVTIESLVKIVRTLVGCRAPEWPTTNDSFIHTARLRVSCFCRAIVAAVPATEATPAIEAKQVTGREAMCELYKQAKADKDQGTSLTFQSLMPFRLYPWLLLDEEKRVADEWLADVVGTAAPTQNKKPKDKGASATKKEKLQAQADKAKKRKLASLYA